MINALQKTLKRSQYMQNMLCFGAFVGQDASNNCCDSRLNLNCYPAKRGQNHLNCHPLSEERARLGVYELIKKSVDALTSELKLFGGMTFISMTVGVLKGGCYGK